MKLLSAPLTKIFWVYMKLSCLSFIQLFVLLSVVSCQFLPTSKTIDRIPANEDLFAPRLGFVDISDLDPTKKTVCAMTLNSAQEILAFQRNLDTKNFQFVELVTSRYGWLEKAIKSKVKCDLLVISSHFAGIFFGERGSISLTEFEDATCKEGSSGLFNHPKEVFLFGCNTLAGKKQDQRTPQEYIQVLLEDGFTVPEAEQIAAFRYSPVGHSFNSRMSRLFAGVPRVYGFTSVSPLGPVIEPWLEKYLKKTDYNQYFDQIDEEKNEDLFKFLKAYSLAQVSGQPVVNRDSNPRCILHNKKKADSAKLLLVDQILSDKEMRFHYIEELGRYLLRSRRSGGSRQLEARLHRKWDQDQSLKQDMSVILDGGLKSYPTLRIQLLEFAQYMGWLTGADVKRITREALRDILKDGLVEEDSRFIASLGDFPGTVLTYTDIQSYFEGANKKDLDRLLEAFRYLKPTHRQIHLSVAKLLKAEASSELRQAAAAALGYGRGSSFRTFDTLVETLKTDLDAKVRYQAEQSLGRLNKRYPEVLKALVSALHDPDPAVQKGVGPALGRLQPRDSETLAALFSILKSDPSAVARGAVAIVFSENQSQDPSIFAALTEAMAKDSERSVRSLAVQALGKLEPRDAGVHLLMVGALVKEPDVPVQQNLVRALKQLNPQDPQVLFSLIDIMKTDPNDWIRRSCFEIVQGARSSDPRIQAAISEFK